MANVASVGKTTSPVDKCREFDKSVNSLLGKIGRLSVTATKKDSMKTGEFGAEGTTCQQTSIPPARKLHASAVRAMSLDNSVRDEQALTATAQGVKARKTDQDGPILLHDLVKIESFENLFKLIQLIDDGADVNQKDGEGYTALYHAAKHDNGQAWLVLSNNGHATEYGNGVEACQVVGEEAQTKINISILSQLIVEGKLEEAVKIATDLKVPGLAESIARDQLNSDSRNKTP